MEYIENILVNSKKVPLFLLLLVFSITIFSINKGFIFSDDAFYYFHFQEGIETMGISCWYHLWKPFHFENFFFDKLILVTLSLITSFILGYVFSKDFKIGNKIAIASLLTVSQFAMFAPIQFTPSYLSLNLLLFNCIGFLYIKTCFEPSKSNFILIGFVAGFIPFVMVTNSPIILLLFLVYVSNSALKKNLLYCVIGFVLALLTYFVFFQPFPDFYKQIAQAKLGLSYDKSHGISNMLIWIKTSFSEFTFASIFLFAYYYFKRIYGHKKSYMVLLSISCGLLIIYLFESVFNIHYVFSTKVFYVLLFMTLINKWATLQNKVIGFVVFFALLPFWASLGTDVDFFIRSAVYFPFLLLSLLLLFKSVYNNTFVVLVLFLIVVINFLTLPFRGTWNGFIIAEQNVSIKIADYGPDLFIDKERANRIKEVTPFIKNSKNVIPSFVGDWGVLYLNKAAPPFAFFRIDPFSMSKIKNMDLDSMLLIENKLVPFDFEELNSQLNLQEYSPKVTETPSYRIYKYQKKR
jgi:hypothetical protein